MELSLVLLAAGDEQHIGVLGVQEPADRVPPPALAAVRQGLAPSVVRIDGFEPAGRERMEDAGLASTRHPGQQHPLHGRDPTTQDARSVRPVGPSAGWPPAAGTSPYRNNLACSPAKSATSHAAAPVRL